MNTSHRFLLGVSSVALVALTFPAASTPAGAACAALGSYTVVANGGAYAASAPGVGSPLVLGGKASIVSYSGCGSRTLMHISTDGPGTALSKPVTPLVGITLRARGDLLLHFNGDARQDPQAPSSPTAVLLSGTATYARVSTTGVLRGKQVRLTYTVKTVKVANARGQLHVTAELGGVFSLYLALPGPSLGQIASSFSYFAVGAKSPANLKKLKAPLSSL